MLPRYEEIAELTGVSLAPFGKMHAEEVLKFKHLVLGYMRSAIAMQQQLKVNGIGIPVDLTTGVGVTPFAPELKYSLAYTANGFPVLPRPMDTQGWTKKVWEQLYMEYMCCHYSE